MGFRSTQEHPRTPKNTNTHSNIWEHHTTLDFAKYIFEDKFLADSLLSAVYECPYPKIKTNWDSGGLDYTETHKNTKEHSGTHQNVQKH